MIVARSLPLAAATAAAYGGIELTVRFSFSSSFVDIRRRSSPLEEDHLTTAEDCNGHRQQSPTFANGSPTDQDQCSASSLRQRFSQLVQSVVVQPEKKMIGTAKILSGVEIAK